MNFLDRPIDRNPIPLLQGVFDFGDLQVICKRFPGVEIIQLEYLRIRRIKLAVVNVRKNLRFYNAGL
jgi:hypothetical protein